MAEGEATLVERYGTLRVLAGQHKSIEAPVISLKVENKEPRAATPSISLCCSTKAATKKTTRRVQPVEQRSPSEAGEHMTQNRQNLASTSQQGTEKAGITRAVDIDIDAPSSCAASGVMRRMSGFTSPPSQTNRELCALCRVVKTRGLRSGQARSHTAVRKKRWGLGRVDARACYSRVGLSNN